MAKKGWELSHLQSLREEEERLAEVEVQDVMLTYDGPETSNKVILRRKPSTGTWEICSPSSNHGPLYDEENVSENKSAREPRRDQLKKQENGREGFAEGLHSKRFCVLNLSRKAVHRRPSSNVSISAVPDYDSVAPAISTSPAKLQPKRDPMYQSDGSENELVDPKGDPMERRTPPTPRRGLQVTIQKLPDTLSVSNHIVDAHCVSSRTRQRTVNVNDEVRPLSHKRPSRHKFAGLNH